MKFIFRAVTIFEYNGKEVIQHKIHGIAAFDFCKMIPQDYKLLSEFFITAYSHLQGEEVELNDIEVY